jgi:predicted PurR-regulated permease PerM
VVDEPGVRAPDEEPARPRRLTFGFATALALVGTVLAAIVLAGAVSAASQPLGWALACAVVAALVVPLVGFFERRMHRVPAVLLTLLVLLVVLGGAWAGTVATVTDNVETLVDDAPAAAAEIEVDNEAARDFELEDRVTAFVEDIDARLGRGAAVGRSASTVSSYLVSGILVVFLIAYGPRFVAGGLDQIDDPARRRRVATIGADAVHRWRRYVLATVAQALALTLVAWPVLWGLDLPAPFVLALIIGGFSIIPYVGVLIGAIPTLLFALATAEPARIWSVVGLVLVLQLFEGLVIRRRVDPSSLYVGPALPLIVALIGWSLYGLGGAVYGVILLVLALAVAEAAAVHPADDAEPIEPVEPVDSRSVPATD